MIKILIKFRIIIYFVAAIFILEFLEHAIDKLFFDGDGQLYFLKLNYIISMVQTLLIALSLFIILHSILKKLGNSRIVRILMLVISIFIYIGLVEVFLRLIDKPDGDRTNYITAGWKLHKDYKEVNELGYRGQKIQYTDSSIIVILLGDSQVEAQICSFSETPEQVLEKKLQRFNPNYKVFSLGASAYGTDQEYLALKNYFSKYRANYIILWQTIENDIWNNMFPTNSLPKDGTIKPTFWLDKQGTLKGPNYNIGDTITFLGKIASTDSKLIKLYYRIIYRKNYHPEIGMDQSWEKYFPKPYAPIVTWDAPYFSDWEPDSNLYNPYLPGENFTNEKTHYSIGLVPESERLKYGLELTKKIQQKISELCKENNAELFIFNPRDPDFIASLKSHEIKCQKVGNYFYLYSDSAVDFRQRQINKGLKVFQIEVKVVPWIINKLDTHLNPKANYQVITELADSVFTYTNK